MFCCEMLTLEVWAFTVEKPINKTADSVYNN